MQKEVENRTLTLVVSGTKFTGRMFKAAIGLPEQRFFRARVVPSAEHYNNGL